MSRPGRGCGGAMAPALAGLLALAGCAGVPPYQPPAPQAGTPARAEQPAADARAATAPRDTIPVRAALAAPDTVPSADAQAVLASIPEPLKTEERVPPPDAAALVAPGADDDAAAGADSADAGAGGADVPVPARTPVLGERALPEVAAATDTTAPPRRPPDALTNPPAPGPAGAAADTCWRLQIAAWAERARAERYLEAGTSQLAVPWVIEREAGLYKVRTRDCMDRAAVETLRQRARDAGFDGAFRFRGRKP